MTASGIESTPGRGSLSTDNANAAHSATESPQPVSLEQPERREAQAPARDLGLAPKRYASLEPPRVMDLTRGGHLGMPFSRILFDAPALARMAHTLFSRKYQNDCKVDKAVLTDSTVTLTSNKRAELERVNATRSIALLFRSPIQKVLPAKCG